MALGEVLALVKEKLPYADDSSFDTVIQSEKLQQYYYLQVYKGLEDSEVETDSNWTGLWRLLVVNLVCYQMIRTKAIQTTGGSFGDTNPDTRKLKKAKADVVEAEFVYIKASDGSLIQMSAEDAMNKFKETICSYAKTLKINLSLCQKTKMNRPIFKTYDVPDTTT